MTRYAEAAERIRSARKPGSATLKDNSNNGKRSVQPSIFESFKQAEALTPKQHGAKAKRRRGTPRSETRSERRHRSQRDSDDDGLSGI